MVVSFFIKSTKYIQNEPFCLEKKQELFLLTKACVLLRFGFHGSVHGQKDKDGHGLSDHFYKK